MAHRISRAKQRIKAAGASFDVPPPAEQAERLGVVGRVRRTRPELRGCALAVVAAAMLLTGCGARDGTAARVSAVAPTRAASTAPTAAALEAEARTGRYRFLRTRSSSTRTRTRTQPTTSSSGSSFASIGRSHEPAPAEGPTCC
jgi:hypothetical protein